jgi:iron(III) transport system substrate-binding protein
MPQQACKSLLLITLVFLFSSGCVPQPENSVVVYSAADREYAKPILDSFQRKSAGIEVVPQFDVESTKTVGLANRIAAESEMPRADVFWNNEIMHTIALEKKGLLQSISWDIPSGWPKEMRSSSGNWVGIAARARVLIVNRNMLPSAADRPVSVMDLADPKWQDKCAVARPLFGTTATHFTVLIDQLGEKDSRQFFEKVSKNAVVLSGNKQVAQQVSSGQLAWGLTDTDDALIEIDSGMPVEIIFPDQQPGQLGTLRIPNTVAVIKKGPHPVAAAKLANFLVSQDTEGRLAMGSSGQFPIRPEHPQESRAQVDKQGKRVLVRWMEVDFSSAADRWPKASQELQSIF